MTAPMCECSRCENERLRKQDGEKLALILEAIELYHDRAPGSALSPPQIAHYERCCVVAATAIKESM